ncbi:hypothetical protein KIN20_008059 [Parelaphostrongylus tenuis]|uniref:Uncharacterized protein n=1 Tax=Parelaphostrongylus tenuis TaxID=148309 RepID=A0AAD5M6A8_PARTN|nr:hypothetical protein KIN20_008059 [Parelaphostrongylus tenuis]
MRSEPYTKEKSQGFANKTALPTQIVTLSPLSDTPEWRFKKFRLAVQPRAEDRSPSSPCGARFKPLKVRKWLALQSFGTFV